MTSARRGRASVRPLASRIARFARERTVLLVSALAALATVAFVPPDEAYLGYFDVKTLACLFGILAVVGALRGIGLFEHAARLIVARFATCRSAVAALVGSTLVLSMFATNDLALIMMLPLSAATLIGAGHARLVAPVFVLQSLAANLCGMIMPFGNPQNLYLYSYYGLHLGDFLRTMALPFALSTAGVVACTWWLCGHSDCNDSRSDTHNTTAPMPLSRRRLVAYGLLLALTLLAVFHIVPIAAAVVIVAATLAALDRRALVAVDWGLLATFACFFVFAGNMARVPEVSAWLSPLMADHGLLVSAGLSQIISNVPAAVLLSHFAGAWQPLLIGVNIGGAGTLVGSLASLITLQHFTSVRKVFPQTAALPELSTSRFLILFSVLNFAFLAILLIACGMTSFF